MRRRILAVVGTRPEAIKMAPVIQKLRDDSGHFETLVCATAQHREMLDAALALFDIRPDIDLDLMEPDQTINAIASRVFDRFDRVLARAAPDLVLVQGDTTTVMAAALASFHRNVEVAHVEAGLRTGIIRNPFPEEMNRRVTSLAADLHFAPTQRSAEALAREGIDPVRIHVTGNTVVDALGMIAPRLAPAETPGDFVLITAHRRENFGEPMERVFRAIARLARRFPKTRFVFPVHPNPNVRKAAGILDGIANVERCDPVDYLQLVAWLRDCRLVLTDSGGIQEEAPAFGAPVLVLRDCTERPEGIDAGVAVLVGTDEERIYSQAERLLTDDAAHAAMARRSNPYGDGRAAERIAAILSGRTLAPFRAVS